MNTDTLKTVRLFEDDPLVLDGGQTLGPVDIAYETWGTLNKDASNAVLICHALTGDQFAAGDHPVTGRKGWWDRLIGPGRVIDTDRYFVICSNVLGSCMGSTGPASNNPATGQPFALEFPVITVRDMVRAQKALVVALGITKLAGVIGGSMGGMQALEWMVTYPEDLHSAILLATSDRHSAQNIALHEVGRQAIMADPNWQGGAYLNAGTVPSKGLAVARMTAHISYLSEEALTRKFGRNLQDRDDVAFGFDADFQVESYLRHQGQSFVDRFDANSYLYITRAMDYLAIADRFGGRLADAFSASQHIKTCVLSFTSDWLYPTEDAKRIVRAMTAAGLPISFAELETDAGHDAFLLDLPEMDRILKGFLDRQAHELGLGG